MDDVLNELSTLGDWVRWSASQFQAAGVYFGHGTDNALDEACALVLHTLHLPMDTSDIYWACRLVREEKQSILMQVNKRIEERLPLPYIVHEAWFSKLSFYVDKRVLIPRSPIAELIEQQFVPWVDVDQVERVLELCTGCGCIAIASALHAFPDAKIDATDISTEALAVAKINVEQHGVGSRVNLICSDLFAQLDPSCQYDLIIANPPYVNAIDMAKLPDEYRHEPRLALASGADGLYHTRQILRKASSYLSPHGILIVEVGDSGAALEAVFLQVPFTWLEFVHGGHGVFLLSAEQLRIYADQF